MDEVKYDVQTIVDVLKRYDFLAKVFRIGYWDLAVDNELDYLKRLDSKVKYNANKIPKELLKDKEIKEKVTGTISALEEAVKFKEKEPNKKRGVQEDVG